MNPGVLLPPGKKATPIASKAQTVSIPSGLRFRPLDRYPYLVFYMDAGDRIHTWRVLRGAPDIPA